MSESLIPSGRPLSESALRRRLRAIGYRLRKQGDGYGVLEDGIPKFGWDYDKSLAEVQAWYEDDSE